MQKIEISTCSIEQKFANGVRPRTCDELGREDCNRFHKNKPIHRSVISSPAYQNLARNQCERGLLFLSPSPSTVYTPSTLR